MYAPLPCNPLPSSAVFSPTNEPSSSFVTRWLTAVAVPISMGVVCASTDVGGGVRRRAGREPAGSPTRRSSGLAGKDRFQLTRPRGGRLTYRTNGSPTSDQDRVEDF